MDVVEFHIKGAKFRFVVKEVYTDSNLRLIPKHLLFTFKVYSNNRKIWITLVECQYHERVV
jgi:hypothetical protein